MPEHKTGFQPIAIVGLAGRFPDAGNLEAFWKNLAEGVESLIDFSEEDMLAAGVDPAQFAQPNYVRKGTILEGAELFDAGFFGFNPREAEVLDPQQRVFMECAWEALENAGYGGEAGNRSIGVYAGESLNTYVFKNLLPNRDVLASVGAYQVMLSTDKDYLATRVAYKLNLNGPAITIQTACSTSLVAVQLACRSLLDHQCDMAMAGGVSVGYPSRSGYLYTDGMILSPDGHCRPFDEQARGTRPGAGAGVVVLKRLEDALRDRDCIRAVILGAAINNDGSAKIGYTAPSVEGQARVVEMAQAMADVDPESITYVEAHGTATVLGDPIEFAALQRVFRAHTPKKQFCAIGSLKGNLGHLDAAAGVAGLIKTVLAMEHQAIPPTLHFRRPNPQIDLAASPFYVNDKLREWKAGSEPRRAGVSSFGIGGTNAHVVLEEAPAQEPSNGLCRDQLVVLSAKTAGALTNAAQQLGRYLSEHPALELADAAYTLQVGRRRFPYRRHLVCASREEAVELLSNDDFGRVEVKPQESLSRAVSFLFSGQGSQYPRMAEGLYRDQPMFRACLDECALLLQAHLGCDLRDVLYNSAEASNQSAAEGRLNETWLTQPALFAVEYSLARMWMSWGIVPDACLGHSIGEYVAACIAGVFSLEDGLALVSTRGRLMQALPRGSMLAVSLPAEQVNGLLNGSLSIAAANTDRMCTVSGPDAALLQLEAALTGRGVACRRISTSHAFHSAMMDPVLESFSDSVRRVRLSAPRIPFLSNLTGAWIRPEEACDPAYWALHMRHTVRFADGLRELLNDSGRMLLEVGPGQTLSNFARELIGPAGSTEVLSSLPHRHDPQPASHFALQTLGKLWAGGAAIDWEEFHHGESLHRVPLPTYPFERKRYCVEPKPVAPPSDVLKRDPDVANWYYVPTWKRSAAPSLFASGPDDASAGPWLLFLDEQGLGTHIQEVLAARGQRFVAVRAGDGYQRSADGSYIIAPGNRGDYDLLLRAVWNSGELPRSIMHLWNVSDGAAVQNEFGCRDFSFNSLLYLAQAWSEVCDASPLNLLVVANQLQSVSSDREPLQPAKALVLGPCKVIPQEYPEIHCRCVDVAFPEDSGKRLAENLLLDFTRPTAAGVVAYRFGNRWDQVFEPTRLPDLPAGRELRPRGVYLVTGGLGGIGLTLARYLAETVQARLVLTGRSPLPPREDWDSWLAVHAGTDSTSDRIRAVRSLEAAGAEVLVLAADVSDAGAMRGALDHARQRFGRFDGAIHAAGIARGGLMQLTTAEAVQPVLAAKVDGTLILESLLHQDCPDFLLLCSSINGIIGAVGAVDYTAANAFLDAFALSRAGRDGCAVISINWDTWQEVGMAVKAWLPPDLSLARQRSLESSIRPAEGVKAFRQVLGARLPQVAVVPRDFRAVLSRPASTATVVKPGEVPPVDTGSMPGHARPEGAGKYTEPETETQRQIVGIWREVLGIQEIGIDDNFFALGGHSLLATGVLSRIRSIFGLSLPLRTAFESPTIRGLAEQVETVLWATSSAHSPDASSDREQIEL
jgi:acyl transferase domain-containing protein/acyl carrier protein